MRAETTTVRTYGRKSGLLRPYVRALVVSARTYGRFGSAPQSRSARQPPVSGSTTNAPAGGAVAKRLGWFTRDTLYRVIKRVFQIISGQSTAYVMRW